MEGDTWKMAVMASWEIVGFSPNLPSAKASMSSNKRGSGINLLTPSSMRVLSKLCGVIAPMSLSMRVSNKSPATLSLMVFLMLSFGLFLKCPSPFVVCFINRDPFGHWKEKWENTLTRTRGGNEKPIGFSFWVSATIGCILEILRPVYLNSSRKWLISFFRFEVLYNPTDWSLLELVIIFALILLLFSFDEKHIPSANPSVMQFSLNLIPDKIGKSVEVSQIKKNMDLLLPLLHPEVHKGASYLSGCLDARFQIIEIKSRIPSTLKWAAFWFFVLALTLLEFRMTSFLELWVI